MLIEENARQKRCPMPMGTMHDQRTQNHCIASECMAWRFAGWVNLMEDGSLEQAEDRHGPFVMPHGPTANKHGCVHVGYCGAFGRSSNA